MVATLSMFDRFYNSKPTLIFKIIAAIALWQYIGIAPIKAASLDQSGECERAMLSDSALDQFFYDLNVWKNQSNFRLEEWLADNAAGIAEHLNIYGKLWLRLTKKHRLEESVLLEITRNGDGQWRLYIPQWHQDLGIKEKIISLDWLKTKKSNDFKQNIFHRQPGTVIEKEVSYDWEDLKKELVEYLEPIQSEDGQRMRYIFGLVEGQESKVDYKVLHHTVTENQHVSVLVVNTKVSFGRELFVESSVVVIRRELSDLSIKHIAYFGNSNPLKAEKGDRPVDIQLAVNEKEFQMWVHSLRSSQNVVYFHNEDCQHSGLIFSAPVPDIYTATRGFLLPEQRAVLFDMDLAQSSDPVTLWPFMQENGTETVVFRLEGRRNSLGEATPQNDNQLDVIGTSVADVGIAVRLNPAPGSPEVTTYEWRQISAIKKLTESKGRVKYEATYRLGSAVKELSNDSYVRDRFLIQMTEDFNRFLLNIMPQNAPPFQIILDRKTIFHPRRIGPMKRGQEDFTHLGNSYFLGVLNDKWGKHPGFVLIQRESPGSSKGRLDNMSGFPVMANIKTENVSKLFTVNHPGFLVAPIKNNTEKNGFFSIDLRDKKIDAIPVESRIEGVPRENVYVMRRELSVRSLHANNEYYFSFPDRNRILVNSFYDMAL